MNVIELHLHPGVAYAGNYLLYINIYCLIPVVFGIPDSKAYSED